MRLAAERIGWERNNVFFSVIVFKVVMIIRNKEDRR